MLIIKKIISFIKLIWEQHHQLAFVTIVPQVMHNCLLFAQINETLNSGLFEVVTGHHKKI